MFDVGTIWLKTSYWTLNHAKELKKWWAVVLLAAAVFMVVFSITNAIIYLINSPQQNSMISSIASDQVLYQEYREKILPIDIQIDEVLIVPTLDNLYILVAKITNSNVNWAADTLQYKFEVDGQEAASSSDFIQHQSSKMVVVSGYRFSGEGVPKNVSFSIEDTNWQKIRNFNDFPQANFLIEDVEYKFSTADEVINTVNVIASITNKTLYNFWQTKFLVVLYNYNKIVGLSSRNIDQFETLETENLDITLTASTGAITRVDIVPDINLFEQDNYME